MKPGKEGIALITKWVFETYAEGDSTDILSLGNDVDDAGSDSPGLSVDPYIDTTDRRNVGSTHTLSEADGYSEEDDPLGGWIVDRRDWTRCTFALSDADAPNITDIAQSQKCHKVPPLLLL